MAGHGPISNYPNGFLDGVTIRGVPLLQTHPGEVFWVNSTTVLPKLGIGASNGNKGTYTQAFSTLDFAVGKCLASRGDVIVLMPGFTETISDATSLTLDVAGVAVVGLGSGTLRATITLDTATTASVIVSAANVSFKNVVFSANFADVADLFTLTAVDFHCEDCDFVATGTNLNFIEIIDTSTTDNEVDGLSFLRCVWIEPDLLTTSLVNGDADIDRMTVEDCYFNLGVNTNDLPVIADMATGKDLSNVRIVGNECIRLNNANPLLVVTDTTTNNTGIMHSNMVRHLDTAAELLITAGTNIGLFNNDAQSAVDVSGALVPGVDDSASNFIGADNSNNDAATTNVAANENGSVLERLEQVQEATNVGTGTSLAANTSVLDYILGSGSSGRSALKGTRVQRAAADIFDGTTTSLFTVSNGRVLITHLSMETSVATVDATASATKFIANPTTGSSVDLCATLDVTGDEIGTLYSITGTLSDALVGVTAGAVAEQAKNVIVNIGTIDLSSAADAGTGTAVVSVDLWFIPLDDTATVVTA